MTKWVGQLVHEAFCEIKESGKTDADCIRLLGSGSDCFLQNSLGLWCKNKCKNADESQNGISCPIIFNFLRKPITNSKSSQKNNKR